MELPDWFAEAACTEHQELFLLVFDGTGASSPPYIKEAEERALSICREQCPVRGECLAYAVSQHLDWGIWGGMRETHRRELRGTARKVYIDAT